jgi:hypothetical protein
MQLHQTRAPARLLCARPHAPVFASCCVYDASLMTSWLMLPGKGDQPVGCGCVVFVVFDVFVVCFVCVCTCVRVYVCVCVGGGGATGA